jgi:hypothetical protein
MAMSSAAEIADRAMALAEGFLAGSRDEIVRMAAGERNVLYEASQLVRKRAAGEPSVPGVEHLAFSLITAAHEIVRKQAARSLE